jgi:hypothetical protein
MKPGRRGPLSLRKGKSAMQAARTGADAGIESELLDLGGVSLSRLRTLDNSELRKALRHAVERVAYIQVTASNGEARRVD